MDINQLSHFQAAAKYENITQAAAELYITQSALSKSIRQLEKELHASLFDRHGKTIALNSSGKIVLKYAKLMLEMRNLMNKALDKEAASKGALLNLATNRPVIAHNLFPQITVQHPELNLNTNLITVERDTATQFLVSGIYDLLITNFPIENDEITSFLHSEETLCLCVTKGSPLASRKIIKKEDFEGLALPVTPFSYDTIVKPLTDELKKSGISLNTFMVPDIATVNYLMKISDIPSIFTDVAWSFNSFPNRTLIEIEGIPHRRNYVSYLKQNESSVEPLANLLMTEYKDFSDEQE